MVGIGKVKIEINQRFALADAAEAHRALEARADHRLDRPDRLRPPAFPFRRLAG